MKYLKKYILPASIFFVLLIFLSGRFFLNDKISSDIDLKEEKKRQRKVVMHKIKIGKAEIEAQIVEKPEEQRKGLSKKETLPEDEGMLFVFRESAFHVFWMKEMLFPIDIIWISKGQVIGFEKNAPPAKSNTPNKEMKRYRPPEPVEAVLEVKAGFVEKEKISIGDEVKFSGLEAKI